MKFNLLQSQTLNSNALRVNDERSGISSSYQSSFSTVYRLVDLSVITLCFYATMFYYAVPVTTGTLILLFISVVAFQVSAEALDLYRSWRSSHTSALMKTAAIGGIISFGATLIFAFAFAHALPLTTTATGVWFGSALVGLTSWRLVLRQILFKVRRSGLNARSAIIIGANDVGYNMALQMMNNDQLGIHFHGVYDDRPRDRVAENLSDQIKGNIDQAIALAKAHQIDYIYIALPTSAEDRIKSILEKCSDTTANVYLIPNFFMYTLLNSRWQSVGNAQALSV